MSKRIKVEFWQKVKYSGEMTVTDEEFELLNNLEDSEVPMYVRKNGKMTTNEVYGILECIISSDNIIDATEELEDVKFKEKLA